MMSLDTTAGRDGVSARRSAGTPSHMTPSSRHHDSLIEALGALEFPQVLEVVAGFAAGPLGAERIRRRRPSSDAVAVARDLAPVGELLTLYAAGEEVEAWPVPELGTALTRLRLEGSVLEGAELFLIHQTLVAARATAAELRRVAERAPLTGTLRVPIPDAAVDKRLAASVDERGEVLDSASPALARARREVHASRERLIKKLEAILRSVDPAAVPSGATITVRNGRYVIPVRRDSRARPDGIVHDESATAGTLFVEPGGAVELGNALRAAIAEAEREALRVLRELTELLRPEADALAAAHGMCVALDDLVARARYGRAVGAAVPAVLPQGSALLMRHARHPLLLARGVSVVPFDLTLEPGEHTLLISGPNTGGKTVLLKTVGVTALAVQSGIVPPLGEGSALPVFSRVFADIGDHQSIAADLSTFSAHVATLRRVLDEADPATLVLIDEIGSGTDPAEGGALAAASLRALTARRALTVATTHLGALKALAAETPGIVNGSLQFDAEQLAPTYRFQKGAPGRSYGLAIARRLGVAGEVLAAAESMVAPGERSLDALLESAEARERALSADQAELADRLARAEREAAGLEALAESLGVRERELKARQKDADRRARAEARDILLAARGRVEQALKAAAAAVSDDAAREARRLLEDAIQGNTDSEETSADSADRSGVTIGALEPGSRVRLESGALGRLLEVRDDGKAVVMAGAVRLVVPARGLVAVAGTPTGQRSWGRREGEAARSGPSSGGAAELAPMEIDLRGMRVDEAQSVTVAALDAAVLADHPFLRIIHGMGTGAVRKRVREVLGRDRRVARFEFAPRNQGGNGVTIVEFVA